MTAACLLSKHHVTARSSMAPSVVVVADLGAGRRAVGVDEEVGAAVGSAGASMLAENTTEHLSMTPGSMVVMVVGAAVRAVVDGGATAVGTAAGVEDTGGAGEDDGADDRDAAALVLRVRHIPAFASSIICSMKVICADSASSLSSTVAIRVVRVGGELAESSGSGGDEPCSGTKCHVPG
jgi:hypothetical protein